LSAEPGGLKPRPGAAASATPLRLRDGRSIRVLIAEDEAFIALDLESMVESLGGDVLAVSATADDAIVQAKAQRPDVVLMDIRLALGDGIDAAAVIRAQLGTPVVFVTGNTDPETLRRIETFGGAPLVRKPILISNLRDAILAACEP
jgi:CheY-like chemotaxis protein